jgi:cell volume regulation protein A
VVSSTDAAAVFSVLRSSGIQLKMRVAQRWRSSRDSNDPMAVLLTTVLTQNLLHPGAAGGWKLALVIAWELAMGVAGGFCVGHAGRWLMARVRLPAGGLYPVVTLSLALFTFGSTTVLHGSGFLAVYVAAVILGNGQLPYRTSLLRVHDAVAWLSQIAMFLILGLLVFPSRLLDVAPIGMAIALFLAIVARPAVVALCLVPFGYRWREVAYVGWVGLRGAVPIILATVPVLAGAPGGERLFTLVFFIVVVNALVTGSSVPGLRAAQARIRRAARSTGGAGDRVAQPLEGQLLSYHVDEALGLTGVPLARSPISRERGGHDDRSRADDSSLPRATRFSRTETTSTSCRRFRFADDSLDVRPRRRALNGSHGHCKCFGTCAYFRRLVPR